MGQKRKAGCSETNFDVQHKVLRQVKAHATLRVSCNKTSEYKKCICLKCGLGPFQTPFHSFAFFHQSHNTVHSGGLFALKQWISSSLKHDTVPRVINLYCFYVKTPPPLQKKKKRIA